MRPTFNFYLSRDNGPEQSIDIQFLDNHTRTFAREGNYVFLRASIGEPLLFYPGKGWELVANQSIESEWTLRITYEVAGNERAFFTGYFTWANCNFNRDLRRLEVRLVTDDQYRKTLARLGETYDFMKLGATSVPVVFNTKPVVQLSIDGYRDVLHLNESGGYHRTVTGSTIFAFSQPTTIAFVPGPSSGQSAPAGVFGFYSYNETINANGVEQEYFNANGYSIYRNSADAGNDWALIFNGSTVETSNVFSKGAIRFSNFDFVRITYRARILTDELTFNNAPTVELPDDDPLASGLSYERAAPFDISQMYLRAIGQDAVTNYGRFSTDAQAFAGQYHTKPSFGNTTAVLPNHWNFTSIWHEWTEAELTLFRSLIKPVRIEDAYLLSDVINVVFREASDEEVAHDTSDSTLLYGQDPFSGVSGRRLLLAPISNITTSDYTNASTLGEVRPRQLLDALKMCRNADWYIDGGKLKIEHYRFFDRGLTYNTERVGVDIRNEIEPTTGKSWETEQDAWRYDIGQMPERIKFEQGGEVTPAFKGDDLVMISPHAQEGRSEDLRADSILFDLDYVVQSPEGVNERGFLLLDCLYDATEGAWRVVNVDVPEYGTQQNGTLAVPYIQDTYFRDGLPASRVRMNGQEITATSTRRTKIQTVSLPVAFDANFERLFQTSIGSAKVRAASQRILTGRTEITLNHEPE
jgi:hypothetical protein